MTEQNVPGESAAIRPELVSSSISLAANLALRDQFIAARDNIITNIYEGIKRLRAILISRDVILTDARFVRPAEYDDALNNLKSGFSEQACSVLVLVGADGSGRFATALRLLSEVISPGRKICELRPDWESPNVGLIPCDPETGYILNLRGGNTRLPADFYQDLIAYSEQARNHETVLVITASERVWGTSSYGAGGHTSHDEGSAVAYGQHTPPEGDKILRQLLGQMPRIDGIDRSEWLDDPTSVFYHLLPEAAPPRIAADLARIISTAKSAKDDVAQSEFLGWRAQLTEWFDKDTGNYRDDSTIRRRALQISAAVLNGARVRIVMDSCDALIESSRLHVPTPIGGPLGGPSAEKRCEEAGITIRADGTAAITEGRQHIDSALLRHVWRTRPQMVPILTDWFTDISRSTGPAAEQLNRIAEVLVQLAEAEGASVVVNRADQWIAQGRGSYWKLAIDLLTRVAVHPVIGGEVRAKLAGWAEAKSMPLRQRAVAEVCGGELGLQLTGIALTRIRYVLDNAEAVEPRQAAITALRNLARRGDGSVTIRVLGTAAEWIDAGRPERDGSARAFASMMDVYGPISSETDEEVAFDEDALTFVDGLLNRSDDIGEQVRSLVIDGLLRIVRQVPSASKTAIDIVDGWCVAVEQGKLEHEVVRRIASQVVVAEAELTRANVHRVLRRETRIRQELFADLVEALRGSQARPGAPEADAADDLS